MRPWLPWLVVSPTHGKGWYGVRSRIVASSSTTYLLALPTRRASWLAGDRFGLLITAPHTVVVARGPAHGWHDDSAVAQVEQRLRALLPERDMLVTTKDSDLVLVFGERAVGTGPAPNQRRLMSSVLRAVRRGRPDAEVRLSIGPKLDGSVGIAESYPAARQGVDLAARSGWSDPIVWPEQVAVFAVLLRDRQALVDLVESVLAPLKPGRGARNRC
jgi:sugar diacid utilization regulator